MHLQYKHKCINYIQTTKILLSAQFLYWVIFKVGKVSSVVIILLFCP